MYNCNSCYLSLCRAILLPSLVLLSALSAFAAPPETTDRPTSKSGQETLRKITPTVASGQADSAASATLQLTKGLIAGNKYETQGAFTDGDGVRHTWSVNASHVLVWDNQPFIPVGGRFQAKSWSPKATDQDFASDVEALATLKRTGITDIYVQAPQGGLTSVPVASIQRLLSHLDTEGFTYGISINDGPDNELLAYDIRPGRYRQILPQGALSLRFPVENAVSALFFVVPETGDDILEASEATIVSEGARLAPRRVPMDTVTLLLPRRVYFANGKLGLPNLWDGFDGYRDTLLTVLRQIKFGKGFRFFVDPLPTNLKLSEESLALLPTGPGFQTEWAAWLGKRYKNLDNVGSAWAMSDRELRDFKDAARLLPLWGGGKGVQYLYDPVTDRRLRVNTEFSGFWRDLNLFKAESVSGYMNELSVILKKNVANVPIIYRSGGYSELFNNIPNIRGFDGIGMAAYGRGSDLANLYAGNVYGQAAEATKTLWLPVIATADAAPGEKIAPGYASRIALQSDLDRLRGIGARGFFVDGVRLTDPALKMFDLSRSDEQLAWLADYGKMIAASNISNSQAPEALFFPRGIQYASVKQLPDGSWWVPSARVSVEHDFGVCGKAYAIADVDGGIAYYFWNQTGKRQIHIKIPKAARAPGMPPIQWSRLADGSIRRDVLTMTIGPDPVRLTNFPYPVIPVPTEAFGENAADTKRLIEGLRKRNMMDAGRYELSMEGATKRLNEDNPMLSISEIIKLNQELRAQLQPYAWLEAEKAINHTFDQVRQQIGASGARTLIVDRRPSGSPVPTALYRINVRTDGAYNIWVAASPGSILNFRLDEQTLLDEPTAARPVGTPYGDQKLVWMNIGSATIPRGAHVLEMRADGPATVDAILLIQGEFTPNGIMPPPVNP